MRPLLKRPHLVFNASEAVNFGRKFGFGPGIARSGSSFRHQSAIRAVRLREKCDLFSLLDLDRLTGERAGVLDGIFLAGNVLAFRHPDDRVLRDSMTRAGCRRHVVLRGDKAVVADDDAFRGRNADSLACLIQHAAVPIRGLPETGFAFERVEHRGNPCFYLSPAPDLPISSRYGLDAFTHTSSGPAFKRTSQPASFSPLTDELAATAVVVPVPYDLWVTDEYDLLVLATI